MKKIFSTEKRVLKDFQDENPSQYFSNQKKLYKRYKKNFEFNYTYLFKLPLKIFKDCDLIDFGAGTGDNTLFLAESGANCTLVDMNPEAVKKSKNLFKFYLKKKFNKHKFFVSSIFKFNLKKKFDVVQTRGALAHTENPKLAFKKCASYLKKGGIIIYGDPDMFGGFQNMLQRYIIYSLSKNKSEMIKNCELLFKSDIDRSKKYSDRSRKEIITDRWIVYKQDDPNFDNVMQWFKSENISLYSSYPPTNTFSLDSHMNFPKKNLNHIKGINTMNELFWMRKNKDDYEVINDLIRKNQKFIKAQKLLSKTFSDMRIDSFPSKLKINKVLKDYSKSLNEVETLEEREINSTKIFLKEVNKVLLCVNKNNLKGLQKIIKESKYLFKGNTGMRHVDYIGIKN